MIARGNAVGSCAFEIVGRILGSDVENLYGLLEGAYALHERVDVLIRLVDFDGVEWQDVSRETIESAASSSADDPDEREML